MYPHARRITVAWKSNLFPLYYGRIGDNSGSPAGSQPAIINFAGPKVFDDLVFNPELRMLCQQFVLE